MAKSLGLLDDIKLGQVGGGSASARLRKSVLGDVCEAVIGAIFLDGGYAAAAQVRRAQLDRADAQAAAAAARSQDRAAGMGAEQGHCRRRSIARSSAPDRITIRSSASPSICRGWRRPRASAAAKRAAEKVAASVMIAREGVGGGGNDG